MKTLIFCTSFAATEQLWTKRYRIWLNAIRGGSIQHDHILLMDDASPVLPNWPDTLITQDFELHGDRCPVTIFRFSTRLGRQARTVYPGWYRSFCAAAKFASINGFEKVVHIESDGFIITKRMESFINQFSEGWIAPSIQSHAMPESAIQIMAGSGFKSYLEFSNSSYSSVVGHEAENIIPFTNIETRFIGSRYGETSHQIPREADFVTQTNPDMRGKKDYYWWLDNSLFPF